MAEKKTTVKKAPAKKAPTMIKGGFFDSFDMMKISNVGNLLTQQPSTLTNDMYANARPVFSGISSTVDYNVTGLIGRESGNTFLPAYNGGSRLKAPKPKAPKPKAPKAPKAKF